MKKYIDRQLFLDTVKKNAPFLVSLILPIILITPTADVVPVVRCKDCKHSFFIKSCSKYECKKGCGSLKYSNDYCSKGERK